MSSRDTVLARVRRNHPPAVELPDPFRDGISYADPRGQFLAVLEAVGGNGVVVSDRAAAEQVIGQLPIVREATSVVSLVDGVLGNQSIDNCHEPHELASVDVAIARGEFAVAENAAIWVTDGSIKHRAIYFICQHLVLVIPAREIVHNVHEAYERLAGAFDQPGFSAFISGPSKTADIEQSLVIGAQGPRSLTVVLVE